MATDDDSGRRMGELMERVRSRTQRSWDHTSKVLRNSMLDKRQPMDLLEKSTLQQHLEVLQKAFKVTSVGSMGERLQLLARSLNLKFSQANGGTDILLSSDMFCVQISLDHTALVKEAAISHSGEATTRSCPELVDALSRSDFDEVHAHLEGLLSIYQINGDKKQRTKLLHTIQALETDLQQLYQLSQRVISGVSNYIHKSPLGILQPRVGGKPMRLTYFVGPYDLLDEKTGTSHQMTVEEVTKHQLGYSATVGMEASGPHKLQYVPVMTLQTADGKTLPSFSGLTHANSCSLPAVFVLRLHRPVPLSLSVVRKIQNITSVEFADLNQTRPLLSLILSQMTRGKQDSFNKEQGLFVTLSDQQHCYFLNGVNGTAELAGLMVASIPFTHPCDVTKILILLRQQVLFNSFIGSCMRANPKKDLENSLIFEVTPISHQHVSVTFEHPIRESMATAEFDLTDPTNVRCRICSSEEEKICSDEYACKVVQRSLSLPITLRAILQKAKGHIDQALQLQAAMAQTNSARSKLGQERRAAFLNTHAVPRVDSHSVQFTPPPPPVYVPKSLQDDPLDQGFRHPNNILNPPPDGLDPFKAADQISKTPILANLLDQDSNSPDPPPPSMLSALLGDSSQSNNNAGHKRKQRKRRSNTTDAKSPSNTGKSPKRKMSEDEFNRDLLSGGDMDSSDGTSLQQPQQQQQQAANAGAGGVNNQTSNEDFGVQESHVSRLASTLDNIIKAETKNYPASHPQQQAPQQSETGPVAAYMNDIEMKDAKRIKEESGGEGVTVKLESSAGGGHTATSGSGPKVLQSSLAALLNDSPSEASPGGKRSPPNSMVTTQLAGHGGNRTGSNKVATSSSSQKNSLLAPGGGGQSNSSSSLAGLTSQTSSSKSSGASASRKSSLSKNDSFDHTGDSGSSSRDHSGSGSLLAKMISDWPEKAESETQNRRTNPSTPTTSGPPTSGSGSNSLSKSSSLSSSSTEKKSPDRTNLLKNVSVDVWDEKVLIKEKIKRERSKEDVEKPGITMKLNIKDLTATTIVKAKASPSRDSPHHHLQDGSDSGRSSNKESSSSSSSKSSKESKTVKASPARVYDLVDDSPTNQNLTRTMLVASDGKPGSPSIRIKKIRPDSSSSGDKKRKSSKHSDLGEVVKRRKEDGKKEKSSGKRRRIYDSEFDSKNITSSVKYSMEKGPTTIKITSSGSKLVQSSSKPTSPARSSSKSSLATSSSRSSSALKSHMSEKSSKPGRSISGKPIVRSKSESQALRMADSKLIRTPTIKLKPLVIPGSSTTVTVTNTKTPATAPVSRNSTDPLAALAKNKPQNKSRKNLIAVIDKLTCKQQNLPGSGGGGLNPRRDIPKDPIAEKIKLEAIRKEIIRAGNKPSTPTKEIMKSSQRKDQSSFIDKSDRKSDLLNRSSLQSSNSLQKIGSSKLPSNSTSKLGLVSSKNSSSSGSSSNSQSNNSGDGSSSKTPSSSKDTANSSSSSSSFSSSSKSASLSASSNSISGGESGSKSKSSSSSSSSSLAHQGSQPGHHGPSDSFNSRSDSIETTKRDSGFHKDSYRESHSSSKDGYKESHNSYSSHKETHRDSSHSKESSHKDSHVSKEPVKDSSSSSSSSSSSTLQTYSNLGPASQSTSMTSSSTLSTSSSSNPLTSSSSSSSSSTTSATSATLYNKDTAKESSLTPTTSSSTSTSSSASSAEKSRNSSKAKLEDHGDRTQSRHFLDAVTKIDHSTGSSSGSHKDGDRKSRGSSSETPRSSESGRGGSSNSNDGGSRADVPRSDSLSQDSTRGSASTNAANSNSDKSKPNGQISNHGSRAYDGRPVDPRLYKEDVSGSSTKPETSRLPQSSELVNGSSSSVPLSVGGGGSGAASSGTGSKTAPSTSSSSSSSSNNNSNLSSVCNSTGGTGGSTLTNHTGGAGSGATSGNCSSSLPGAGDSAAAPSSGNSRVESRHLVLNSETCGSEDKENKEEEKLFKAPTPKSVRNSDGCEGLINERHESKGRRESVFSPRSDVSSPEDGLIIDCPGTPGSARSPTPKSREKASPNARSPAPVNSTSDNMCRSPLPIPTKSPRSPSARKAVSNKSPAPSPNAKSPMMPRNSPVSTQHHSPCEIDDDLMDTALIL